MIHLYIGLPGSGKSYHVDEFKEENSSLTIVDLGDRAGLDKLRSTLLNYVEFPDANKVHILIHDPYLVSPDVRDKIRQLATTFKHEIKEIYFENDIESCWHNVEKRNDGRKISYATMFRFKQLYWRPKYAKTIKIHRS